MYHYLLLTSTPIGLSLLTSKCLPSIKYVFPVWEVGSSQPKHAASLKYEAWGSVICSYIKQGMATAIWWVYTCYPSIRMAVKLLGSGGESSFFISMKVISPGILMSWVSIILLETSHKDRTSLVRFAISSRYVTTDYLQRAKEVIFFLMCHISIPSGGEFVNKSSNKSSQ